MVRHGARRAARAHRVSKARVERHEGWLYLAVVMDFFNREIVGRSLKNLLSKWRVSPIRLSSSLLVERVHLTRYLARLAKRIADRR